jgi:hypothetical protein
MPKNQRQFSDDPADNEGRRMARAEAEAFARMQIEMTRRKVRLRDDDERPQTMRDNPGRNL